MNLSQHRVLIYADSSLNIIDGSSVWLSSIIEVCARVGLEVDVLLKVPLEGSKLVAHLRELSNVRLLNPLKDLDTGSSYDTPLTPASAAKAMAVLHAQRPYDMVLVRGLHANYAAASVPQLASILWAYVTDLPEAGQVDAEQRLQQFREVSAKAYKLFAQTEDARSYIEHISHDAIDKVLLLPPMIPALPSASQGTSPAGAAAEGISSAADAPLRVIYAGKFAARWYTDHMCHLPQQLAAQGHNMELTVVGSKFQADPVDPEWPEKMRKLLKTSDGVLHVGGKSRAETLGLVQTADLGLGWRDVGLDLGHEISTKLLEYMSLGVPAVVNRTAMHERLLGADYPFFVDDDSGIVEVLTRAAADRGLIAEWSGRLQEIAQDYSLQAADTRLAGYLGRYLSKKPRSTVAGQRVTKLLIAGHDLKFCREIIEYYSQQGDVEVRIDQWHDLHAHTEQISQELLAWADIIFVEWAAGAAAWYSEHKKKDQRLVVRLHGFEASRPWVKDIRIKNVDQLVFVTEFYRDKVTRDLGWRKVSTEVVPNIVNGADLNRPKLPGAEFHVGITGVVPAIKRLDRALELISALHQVDHRFTLHVRGKYPWQYPWIWDTGLERDYYEATFAQLRRDPVLRQAVVFEGFGGDIGNWNRKIGWILSPSDRETFHLAPVEAMVSGTVPIVWERAGAAEVFGDQFVVADTAQAVEMIATLSRDASGYGRMTERAQDWAQRYDTATVMKIWDRLFGFATDHQ